MPFTVSHIAATLPFAGRRKRFFLPAMVLGSMAPDFEYFLRGRPLGIYGHTLQGVFLFDLPLVVLVYLLGKHIVLPPLVPYFPRFASVRSVKASAGKLRFWVVFAYSALLGIFTHIVWDAFTHVNGQMVALLSILRKELTIAGYTVALYKLLQHGSTLIGLAIIFCYLLHSCKSVEKHAVKQAPAKSRVCFWGASVVVTLLVQMLWCMVSPVSWAAYGVLVVRLIDSVLISLVILALWLRFRLRGSKRHTQ